MNEQQLAVNRRRFLESFSAGAGLMPGALMAVAQDAKQISLEMLEAAQKIAGLSFTRDQQEKILARLNSRAGPLAGFNLLQAADLGSTQPAIVFNPVLPGKTLPTERRPQRRKPPEVSMPATERELAFLPVTWRGSSKRARSHRPS